MRDVSPPSELIARQAASALWLGRYMERIESLARLLDVTRTFAADPSAWEAVTRINDDTERFAAAHPEPDDASVARFYLLDTANPTSIQVSITMARENARTLRALISTEMWLQINVFHVRICALTDRDLEPDRLSATLTMLKEGTQAHIGIAEGTLYRDQVWHFYRIGCFLERADQTTRVLDTRFHKPPDGLPDSEREGSHWHTLLRALAGYHAYRRLYPQGYRPDEVAGFLLSDTAFPRSVGLNLAQLGWHLTRLRTDHRVRGAAVALERVEDLSGMLTPASVEDLFVRGLSPFLDWMQRQIAALHNDIVTGICGED